MLKGPVSVWGSREKGHVGGVGWGGGEGGGGGGSGGWVGGGSSDRLALSASRWNTSTRVCGSLQIHGSKCSRRFRPTAMAVKVYPGKKSRVSDQNGVPLLYIMLEIRHSGREPSKYAAISPGSDRLGGLVVKASASRAEDQGFESRLRRDFSGSSHTSDLKIGTPVATLPGAWYCRVSAGTGRPGVSIP